MKWIEMKQTEEWKKKRIETKGNEISAGIVTVIRTNQQRAPIFTELSLWFCVFGSDDRSSVWFRETERETERAEKNLREGLFGNEIINGGAARVTKAMKLSCAGELLICEGNRKKERRSAIQSVPVVGLLAGKRKEHEREQHYIKEQY